jgi:hypothetical protein
VTETQGNDPNQMRRPSSLSASGAYANWSSGDYGHDGAGNIKTIGTSWYAYDKVNRLVSATLYDGATGGGPALDETLAHELSHAEDADTGTRSDEPACKGCAAQKEVKAVQMQNQLRPNNPRTHFGTLRVPDPTKTPKDPRKGQKAQPTKRVQ